MYIKVTLICSIIIHTNNKLEKNKEKTMLFAFEVHSLFFVQSYFFKHGKQSAVTVNEGFVNTADGCRACTGPFIYFVIGKSR